MAHPSSEQSNDASQKRIVTFVSGQPAELEVVVQRAHAKYAPPSGRFEIRDLRDNRERFDDEDAADDEQQQHLPAKDRDAGQQRAERKRTRIAHEEPSRMTIEDQEAGAGARAGRGSDCR